MRPLFGVVTHVGTEHAIEMPTPEDQDVVQAFRADGPYEPLGEGVGPWRPAGGADDLDFFRPEYLVERTRELRVAVVQRYLIAVSRSATARFLACCVIHAESGCAGRAHHVHSPRRDLDEEQDIERLQPERLHGEEIAGQDA